MIDLATSYLFFTLIILVIGFSSWLMYTHAPSQKFFKYWLIACWVWAGTLFFVLVENQYPVISHFYITIIAPISPLTVIYSIAVLMGKKTLPMKTISGIAILLMVFNIVFTIFYGSILPRIISNNIFYSFSSAFSAFMLLFPNKQPINKEIHQFKVVRINLAIAFILYSFSWFIRLILTFDTSPEVRDLYDQLFVNELSALMIPALFTYVSVWMMVMINSLENQRRADLQEKLVRTESRAFFSRVLGNQNHQLNTALGNAILATDLLKSDQAEEARRILKKSLARLIKSFRFENLIGSDVFISQKEFNPKALIEVLNDYIAEGFSRHDSTYELLHSSSIVHLNPDHVLVLLYMMGEYLTHEFPKEFPKVLCSIIETEDEVSLYIQTDEIPQRIDLKTLTARPESELDQSKRSLILLSNFVQREFRTELNMVFNSTFQMGIEFTRFER
jgi:hypothetical protein